jgi:catechol 2,3-dioxygenase-like lactoylglutathione lyase family enzyme
MKRMHLHVSVPDLAQSIQFYETLFGAAPTVVKDDYARWMLEDPRVNFAISQRGIRTGVDHIGIQVESATDLEGVADRLKVAGAHTFDQEATTCCYARSDKSWVTDPAGVVWETFYTFREAVTYGKHHVEAAPLAPAEAATCCGNARKVPVAACC